MWCIYVDRCVGAVPFMSATVGRLHVGRRTFTSHDELQSAQDAPKFVYISTCTLLSINVGRRPLCMYVGHKRLPWVFTCAVKSSQLCCLNWACWKDLGCACWKEPFSVADCKSCKFTTKNEVKSKFIESGIFATKLLPRNLHDPSHTAAVFGRSLKTFLFSEC